MSEEEKKVIKVEIQGSITLDDGSTSTFGPLQYEGGEIHFNISQTRGLDTRMEGEKSIHSPNGHHNLTITVTQYKKPEAV